MFEKIKQKYEIFRGIVDQCNGDVIKWITFDNPSPAFLKNSIIPSNCFASLTLLLDSGRESYRLSHTRMMAGGTYIDMQTATILLDDFEEVKQRVAYHASLSRKLNIKIGKTERDPAAREFLTTDFRVPIPLTQDYLGKLIERYEKEFRVRNAQITYENLPEYTHNRLKGLSFFAKK